MSNFGERLKNARVASGKSQAEAAEYLEVSRPTLSAIESDKRQVLASEILKFAELYNVTVDSLMSDTEDSSSHAKKNTYHRLMKYQEAFQKLSTDKQAKVLDYIKHIQDES